jgi:hypothetical protein
LLGHRDISATGQPGASLPTSKPVTENPAPLSLCHQILFHSTGGSLEAGLEVGRIIRENGLNTAIGKPVWFPTVALNGETSYGWADIDSGECSSACAYAFLGGVRRDLASGQLGFHRFSPDDGGLLPGNGGIIAGQIVSSVIVQYLTEMGIDPRVFRLASRTASSDLYFPTAEEFAALRLSTPLGFGQLRLVPSGRGVAAVSNSLDPASPYTHFIEMTIYCHFGHLRLDLLSDIGQRSGFEEYGNRWLLVDEQEIGLTGFQIEDVENRSVFRYEVEKSYSELIAFADSIVVGFFADEASGGLYEATINLNDQDRASLFAAFNNCVER